MVVHRELFSIPPPQQGLRWQSCHAIEEGEADSQAVLLSQLEGIPSIILGLFIWFLMPDWPETAKFLTDEERLFVKERLGPYAPKGTDEDFNKKEFFAVLLSWQFWAFAIIYFMMTNSLNAVVSRLSRCLQLEIIC